jgi:hypothetical protein
MDQVFTRGFCKFWWGYQVVARKLEIGIVKEHASIFDFGITYSIKLVKVLIVKGLGKHNHTICTEVEGDDGIPIHNGSDRLTRFINNDERGIILIIHFRVFLLELLQSLKATSETMRGFSKYLSIPTVFDYIPVILHRNTVEFR